MLAVSLGRKMLLRSQKSAPYTLLLRSGFSASWRAVPRAESLRAITESRDGLRVSVQNGRMVGRPSVVGLKVKPCLRVGAGPLGPTGRHGCFAGWRRLMPPTLPTSRGEQPD